MRTMWLRIWSLVAVVLATACSRFDWESNVEHVPAGAAPPGSTGIVAGDWSQWSDAKPVVMLYEPIFYSYDEDEGHAQLVAFADGRVLQRVTAEDGRWHWWVSQRTRAEIEALRRSVARDLAGTPRRFSCRDATHQRRSFIFVRNGGRWRGHEGYALSACLDGVAEDFIPSSSHADPLPPGDTAPAGFVRAYRRLHAIAETTAAGATPWHSPKLRLLWLPDTGEYSEPRVGKPWPADLPAPPAIDWSDAPVIQPVDGAFDERVREHLGKEALVQIEGGRYLVSVMREQPADALLDCLWDHPWRPCTRVRDD
jgi:hypothetical protein